MNTQSTDESSLILGDRDQLRCTCLRSIKKNIRGEEELPASLVSANPDTGQSVVDKDLLSNLLCACLHVNVYVYFTTIHKSAI